jgi:hypothetical protein
VVQRQARSGLVEGDCGAAGAVDGAGVESGADGEEDSAALAAKLEAQQEREAGAVVKRLLLDGRFPHVCPGQACAICRWVNTRTRGESQKPAAWTDARFSSEASEKMLAADEAKVDNTRRPPQTLTTSERA